MPQIVPIGDGSLPEATPGGHDLLRPAPDTRTCRDWAPGERPHLPRSVCVLVRWRIGDRSTILKRRPGQRQPELGTRPSRVPV